VTRLDAVRLLAMALVLEARSDQGPPPDACTVCGHVEKMLSGECAFCGVHVCRGGVPKLGPPDGCCASRSSTL